MKKLPIVKDKTKEGDSSDSEIEIAACTDVITHSEGFQIFERTIYYIKQQSDYTVDDRILFQKWQDYITKKRITTAEQTYIKNFKNYYINFGIKYT